MTAGGGVLTGTLPISFKGSATDHLREATDEWVVSRVVAFKGHG